MSKRKMCVICKKQAAVVALQGRYMCMPCFDASLGKISKMALKAIGGKP